MKYKSEMLFKHKILVALLLIMFTLHIHSCKGLADHSSSDELAQRLFKNRKRTRERSPEENSKKVGKGSTSFLPEKVMKGEEDEINLEINNLKGQKVLFLLREIGERKENLKCFLLSLPEREKERESSKLLLIEVEKGIISNCLRMLETIDPEKLDEYLCYYPLQEILECAAAEVVEKAIMWKNGKAYWVLKEVVEKAIERHRKLCSERMINDFYKNQKQVESIILTKIKLQLEKSPKEISDNVWEEWIVRILEKLNEERRSAPEWNIDTDRFPNREIRGIKEKIEIVNQMVEEANRLSGPLKEMPLNLLMRIIPEIVSKSTLLSMEGIQQVIDIAQQFDYNKSLCNPEGAFSHLLVKQLIERGKDQAREIEKKSYSKERLIKMLEEIQKRGNELAWLFDKSKKAEEIGGKIIREVLDEVKRAREEFIEEVNFKKWLEEKAAGIVEPAIRWLREKGLNLLKQECSGLRGTIKHWEKPLENERMSQIRIELLTQIEEVVQRRIKNKNIERELDNLTVKEDLDNLTVIKFLMRDNQSHIECNGEEQVTELCSICMDDTKKERVGLLHKPHYFVHPSCAKKCVDKDEKAPCPLCRENLSVLIVKKKNELITDYLKDGKGGVNRFKQDLIDILSFYEG